MKLSIIIPIYNGEKYLNKCLESIKSQTYSNFEVILINDGSTDNSKEICEKWAKQDKRFILYNNENHGVSYSRNFGIDKAIGEYITFIDCDDFIKEEALQIMQENCQKYDLVITNFSKYKENKKIVDNLPTKTREYNRKEFLNFFWELYSSFMINSPCNKLYKTSIIKDNNIKFPTSYELGEDLIFNLQYIENSDTFYTANQYIYYYRESTNSLSTKYRDDYLKIQLQLNKYIKDFFIRNSSYNAESEAQLKKDISNIIISSIQNLFLPNCKLKHKEVKQKLSEYLNIPEIAVLKDVQYKEKKLQIFKKMIEKKKIRTIILYSRSKEAIKKILKR